MTERMYIPELVDSPSARPRHHRHRRTIAFIVIPLLAILVAPSVGAQSLSTPDELLELAEYIDASEQPLGVTGDEAVDILRETETVELVAANADVAPEALVDELRSDDAMFVSAEGTIGYVDSLAPTAALQSPQEAALAPEPEAFQLESMPGVGRVLYLDFDGHETRNDPVWNRSPQPSSIVSQPYNTTTGAITDIWSRVAEDFAPFQVNVTTKDPGIEGLRRSSSADQFYGQRVVVSPTNWTGDSRTIGIALLGVFDSVSDRSAFVFTNNLPTSDVAEAISHEAGHTFGLSHDGSSGPAASEYYLGHGPWAPIMGNPTGSIITQWSKGEYSHATDKGDDVARIASYTGYRPDDAGDYSSPKPITGSTEFRGVIGARGDVDVFALNLNSGSFTAALTPLATWANLHASVTVCDASGKTVAYGSPNSFTSWEAVAAATISAPGRYTVEVRPVGYRTANDGFTQYGSMGEYRLTVAGATAAPTNGSAARGCDSRMQPVTPKRVLDTRSNIGGYTRLRGGQQAVVQIAGTSGVPYGASSAVVNITAVGPSGRGFLTAYPCTPTVPNASNVNYVAGQVVSNNTIAALSPQGQLCVWTDTDADVLVDVTGWLGASGASRLTPVNPDRVVDTRRGLGGTRLAAGGTMQVNFTGEVPAGTTAVSFNLTAVGAGGPGFMTAYPCGQSRPNTSTVNFGTGEARPNNAIVGLGSGGRVCIYSYAATEVIVDLTGHFSPSGTLAYKPTPPRRVLDTRGGTVRPPMTAGSRLSYSVVNAPGLGGLDPDAAFVNVTAVDHPREGFVTTYNCGGVPNASTVNQRLGQANANGAIVPLTSTSTSCAWLSDTGHLIVDLNGWWVK